MKSRTDQAKRTGMTLWMASLFFVAVAFSAAPACAAPLAEISPIIVPLSSGPTDFTYDILANDVTQVDRVAIAVPGGYSAAALLSVKVNGVAASNSDQSAGNTIAFLLAAPAAAGSTIQVTFRATPPTAAPVAAAFTSTLDFTGDGLPAVSTQQGNADGDFWDFSSWTVYAGIVIDGSFGDWSGVSRFPDPNNDAAPEKADLRTGWFVVSSAKFYIYGRVNVDACLASGETTTFDVLLDTNRDETYDYRLELEIKGDGTVPEKHLYRNSPADANQSNDSEVLYLGSADTAQVPDNGCDQATEFGIPLLSIGSPSVVNMTHVETHPSGPGTAVADSLPDHGAVQLDVAAGTFSLTGPVINEVFRGSSPGSQWVEIFNSSDKNAALSGFTLTDRDGSGNSNISLPAATLPAGAFLVVHLASGTNDLDFSDGVGHFYTGSPTAVYDAEDQVALYNSAVQNSGSLLDLVAWDVDGARSADFTSDIADAVTAGLWTAGAAVDTASLNPAQSLGRSGDSVRSGAAAEWEITGGRDAADPTPGRRNAGGVVVNEVLMSPGSGTPQGLELYNAGSGSVDVTGWMVSDEDGSGAGALSFVLPQVGASDLVLAPQARVWISLGAGTDSAPALYAPLADPAALGATADQVALYFRGVRSATRITDFVSWDSTASHSSDWLADDDLAQSAAIWNIPVGNDYVDVYSLAAGHSILRTTDGLDTNRSHDWSFSAGTTSGDRDGDLDGVVDPRDNCPDSYNPGQSDQDLDGMGDACDVDLDGDGYLNGLDCSLSDPHTWSIPAEPGNVQFTDSATFASDAVPQTTAYHVYRGSRPASGALAYNHTCFLTSLVGPAFSDAETPAAGTLFYYLVSASDVCGESGLGSATGGSPRPNISACP